MKSLSLKRNLAEGKVQYGLMNSIPIHSSSKSLLQVVMILSLLIRNMSQLTMKH